MAQAAGRAFIDFSDLADAPGAGKERREWIATCAPSVAVALLTHHENTVAHPGA
jgi:hypothetical protein